MQFYKKRFLIAAWVLAAFAIAGGGMDAEAADSQNDAENSQNNAAYSQEAAADSQKEAPELFSQIPSDYIFSSGAGAWYTQISIGPDGSFKGEYSDSDMGDSGEGYDSTHYRSVFSGRFVNPVKLSDRMYSFELESLSCEKPVGTEEITNAWGNDVRVREIYTDAYGIAGGKTFYLYVPGTPVSELPEEFVNWGWFLGFAFDENRETLVTYGFYNENEKQGFFAPDPQTAAPDQNQIFTVSDHRYEIFRQSCTWEDALNACREKGGYLARIDTMDEYNQILSEMDLLGFGDCRLYIGGRRDPGGQQYYWADNTNVLTGNPLNSPDAWCAGNWMAGEPSFRDDSVGADETVMELFYYGEENRWVWNDVPNNLPDYMGDGASNVGFICEYDN